MLVTDWPVKDLYSITNVHFKDIRVDGTGTSVVSARACRVGASFENVDARNVGRGRRQQLRLVPLPADRLGVLADRPRRQRRRLARPGDVVRRPPGCDRAACALAMGATVMDVGNRPAGHDPRRRARAAARVGPAGGGARVLEPRDDRPHRLRQLRAADRAGGGRRGDRADPSRQHHPHRAVPQQRRARRQAGREPRPPLERSARARGRRRRPRGRLRGLRRRLPHARPALRRDARAVARRVGRESRSARPAPSARGRRAGGRR